MAWAEAYLRTKWHLDPCSRLVTTDMGRKLGDCVPFWGAGSPSSTMWPGPRPTSIPSTRYHLDPSSRLATIDMGRKLGGGCAPIWGGEAGSPSSTYLHVKCHLDPSNRLATIHQRYRQREQTDRQAGRQRSDSIGRTVLQTIAPKSVGLTSSTPLKILNTSIKSPRNLHVSTVVRPKFF